MKLWTWIMATLSWERWRTNPFQMYNTGFLILVSTAQLGLGVAPNGVLVALDRNTQMALAFCNFVGAVICMYGLHLKDFETSLWVELSGYLCLVFVLGIYVYYLMAYQYLSATTYGFAFSEAFIYSAIHRSVQILLYKRSNRRVTKLNRLIAEVMREHGPPGDDK